MNDLEPITQKKLFGLGDYFFELVNLEKKNNFPNKILFSGQKGLGKSTLAYHFINYVLSKDENYKYDFDKLSINTDNRSYKLALNKSNPNLTLIDVSLEKKSIDVKQIRQLISNLNQSSFNSKPRFVLIDNIEFLNSNSVNALLKILEEPSNNVNFILIHNNKKILPTLLSRCINYKISLSNQESQLVANELLNGKLDISINKDIFNYYMTPGNIYNLVKFSEIYDYDLKNLSLRDFIFIIINNNLYKKDDLIKFLIFDLIEYYFVKINYSISKKFLNKYNYFLKRISDTKKFNLDEESLFLEFKEEILNG